MRIGNTIREFQFRGVAKGAGDAGNDITQGIERMMRPA